MAENNNCDGEGPHVAGEVHVLPHGADPHHGNSILCRWCWAKEMSFRIERNRELAADARYDILTFEEGKVYGGATSMSAKRAVQILSQVWGMQGNLTQDFVREIETDALPNETALATICRIAGVRYELAMEQPYNHARIRALVAQREVELARS